MIIKTIIFRRTIKSAPEKGLFIMNDPENLEGYILDRNGIMVDIHVDMRESGMLSVDLTSWFNNN